MVNLIFFSPKEAQLLFRQLQKLSAQNIAALKCENRKTKCWVPWYPPYAVKCKKLPALLLQIVDLDARFLQFHMFPTVWSCTTTIGLPEFYIRGHLKMTYMCDVKFRKPNRTICCARHAYWCAQIGLCMETTQEALSTRYTTRALPGGYLVER